MNNKKSFQINNLNTSLKKFTNQLNILLETKNALLDNIASSSPSSSSLSSLSSSTSTSIHTDTDQTQNLENLSSLTHQQTHLEATIKTIQLHIINQRAQYMEITNSIKKAPAHLQNNINNELDIYNNELAGLNELHTETTTLYTDNIKQSEIDKKELLLKTQDIQNTLNNKSTIITNIQINEKLSRNYILQGLHKQKQNKIILQEHIAQINNTNSVSIQQINTLKELNTQLAELKTHIINTHYLYVMPPNVNVMLTPILEETDEHTDEHTDAFPDAYPDAYIMPELDFNSICTNCNNTNDSINDNINDNINDTYTVPTATIITEIIIFLSNNDIHITEGIDEPVDLSNPIYINLLVKQIDDYITGNTTRINKILHHMEKANNINNNTINELKKSFIHNTNTNINTIAQSHHLEDIIPLKPEHSYTRIKNNVGRSKKLAYKTEKNEINGLTMRYTYLQHLYNNYDMLIIDNINNTYNTTINELLIHTQRAQERLTIITERLTNNFNIDKQNMKKQQTLIETNIHKYNEDIELYTEQLQTIKSYIATINKSQIELNDIDIKITNITSTIEQLKNDLNFIENT